MGKKFLQQPLDIDAAVNLMLEFYGGCSFAFLNTIMHVALLPALISKRPM